MEQHYMVHLSKKECVYIIQALDVLCRKEGLNQAANCFGLASKLKKVTEAQEEKNDATCD